jgi:hypothetical protein
MKPRRASVEVRANHCANPTQFQVKGETDPTEASHALWLLEAIQYMQDDFLRTCLSFHKTQAFGCFMGHANFANK